MSLPLALQLYTVREQLDKDFEGTIRQIAGMGYGAVEPYNGAFLQGDQAKETLRLFKELGLTVPSFHADLPLGDAQQRVIDTAQMFDAQYVVMPWVAPDTFATPDSISQFADRLNEAAHALAAHNLTLAYHNHWFEAHTMEGGDYGLALLLEKVTLSVMFEIDLYWIRTGGQNPAEVLKRFGDRVPLLHIKDGPADQPESPMVAVGNGSLDYKSILANSQPKWLIVELDRCATDMLTAVRQSFEYLTREGLGHGR